MPRRDGTGPAGMGSRTGRGLGVCTGVNAIATGRGFGAGYGFGGGMRTRYGSGFGGGRCGRWWGYASPTTAFTPNPQDERQALRNQAELLESELKAVQQRMAELSEKDAS